MSVKPWSRVRMLVFRLQNRHYVFAFCARTKHAASCQRESRATGLGRDQPVPHCKADPSVYFHLAVGGRVGRECRSETPFYKDLIKCIVISIAVQRHV